MTIKVKKTEDTLQNEETRIQSFVNQMLASRMFIAYFVGRFYVDQLKSYRDVLRIQTEEKDIIKDLIGVQKRLLSFYKGSVWSAVTGPNPSQVPTGYCIWVTLDKHLPLGQPRWFIIENAAINQEGELIIKVKDVRTVNTEDKPSTLPAEFYSIDMNNIKNSFMSFLVETVTWQNTKEVFRFLFILIMAILTVLLNSLHYLGDFSLRFFREFNNFIKVSTPIFLAIIDLIKKAIGGLYLIIVMMWRGGNQALPPQQFPAIEPIEPRPYQYKRRPKY